MKKIENFIEHLESPSLNGIIFPDGIIRIIDIEVEWSPRISYSIKGCEDSSIIALEAERKMQWNDCAILIELISERESLKVIAGEGDYGSDGFVAVIDLNSGKLIWLAFFNCSNPFNELKIKDQDLHAISTNGCLWKFKISNPVDLVIECAYR
jgi:hypothetical protein